jgi:hypothetical protein
VIEPEDSQAERQVKNKDAQKVMAEAAMMGERDEVFEIWRKAADDYRRQNETGAPKREGSRGMGESKRHYENYDGSAGGSDRRRTAHTTLSR